MDISNISSVSTDTNCYQSIIEGDSPSMYYSFNETTLREQKQSEDVSTTAETVAEIANEITMDEDFLKSNPGTVIKKEFEKSPLRCSVINKNLYLNLKTLSSHTSTPSQSPKIRRSINQKSRNNSVTGTKPKSVSANISGVISLLEKQDFENVTENPLKLDNNSHISNSFQATSVTSSLFEFEKFEKIFEEGQQKDSNFTDVNDNEKENESFENMINIDELIGDLNLSKITIDDGDKYMDEIRFTPTPMKGIENIEDRKTPIIVIVPPSEDCEKLLKLQNNVQEKKSTKSVHVNDEIIKPSPSVDVLDENKENFDILSIDEKENQLPRITNKNIVMQKTPLIKNENIKKEDIQNSNGKYSTSDKIPVLQKQKNSTLQNQQEQSAISISESSSSVLKTTIELGSVSVTSVVSEDSSIKRKQYESSAKESDDNENALDISKRKVRRSIRQETRKSLIIEETDSSDTCGNKNEKFQKLNADNKKQLRRPSTVHFYRPSVSGLSNKPDLLQNTLSKDTVDKGKSIKPPRPSTVNLPRIDEKRQIKEPMKKQEKQLTNTGAIKKTVVRKSVLPPPPPQQQKEQQNQQRKSQGNIAITSDVVADQKKIIHKISVADKRMSIVNGSKIFKNSPKLLKPKRRSSQIFKTLSSPSIIRRSIGLARSNARKSLIPTTTKIKKPSALVSSSSTTKASAEPTNSIKPSTSNTNTTSTIAADTGEKFKIPAQLFICRICHTSFKLKSTFEMHKKIHDSCIKCQYCDKNFAFAKALDNHHLENCSRIPPLIKKKLVQAAINKKTEEQHQQPHHTSNFSNHPSLSSSTASSLNNVTQASSIDNKLKTDISGGISKVLCCDEKDKFLQPMKNKKNKLPFTGIYRTPNKPIVCYKCKKNFLDVVEFTEHSISHSSSEST